MRARVLQHIPILQVVLDMAQRAARSEGHEAPLQLPDEAKQAWRNIYHMVGGVPRLLSYALTHIGTLGGLHMGQLQPHRAWNTGTLCYPWPSCDSFVPRLHASKFRANRVQCTVCPVDMQVYTHACWA